MRALLDGRSCGHSTWKSRQQVQPWASLRLKLLMGLERSQPLRIRGSNATTTHSCPFDARHWKLICKGAGGGGQNSTTRAAVPPVPLCGLCPVQGPERHFRRLASARCSAGACSSRTAVFTTRYIELCLVSMRACLEARVSCLQVQGGLGAGST